MLNVMATPPASSPDSAHAPPEAPADVDRFLVREIRRGDQRAWKQLIDRYHGRLAAFARARLGSTHEVDDAVQETFVGFLTSLPHFDETRPLETYLFSILRYKVAEALTRRKRAPLARGMEDDSGPDAAMLAVDGETPSSAAAAREVDRRQEQVLSQVLRRLIGELRERDKLEDIRVLELLFFLGLRNKEAADRLSRDEKAIAGVKFRAVQRLSSLIDEMRAELGPEAALDRASLSADVTVANVWRRQRLTCLKRSTLGAFLLGVLDEAWEGYVRFHLDVVACPFCRANRDDLADDVTPAAGDPTEQLFQSSVGFLSRAPSHG